MRTHIRLFFYFIIHAKVGLGWEGKLQYSHRGQRYIADLENQAPNMEKI